MPDRDATIQTFTGKMVGLFHPSAEQVCFEDIARSLSQLCRFTGQVERFYSVAEHTVRGLSMLPPSLAPYFLLHDASEAYLGDISRPLKRRPEMRWYVELEREWLTVIAERFGLRPALLLDSPEVKWADDTMLATEKRDLKPPEESWEKLPPPLPEHIERTWLPDLAEQRFWNAFRELFPDRRGEELA